MEFRRPGDRRISRPWTPEEEAADQQPHDSSGPDPDALYALVVADVGHDGAVLLGTCDLVFAGGPAASVTVEVLTEVPREVLLPIVTRREGDPPEAWDLVNLGRVRLSADTLVTVTIRRTGHGELTFQEPSGIVRDERTWGEIRALVDEAGIRPPPHVDLVCAVELHGTDEEFAERIAFLRKLIDRFHRLPHSSDWLRVALLGYGDHDYISPLPEVRDPVRTSPLDVAEAALRAISRWRSEAVANLLGAPVEDALAKLADVSWRDTSKRLLVTLGVRAPHPKSQSDEDIAANVCSHEHDWLKLLMQAVQVDRIMRVAVQGRARRPVADPFTANSRKDFENRTHAAWRRLGADRWLDLVDADPEEIARLVGVADWWGSRLAVPLVFRRDDRVARPA